MTDIAIVDYGMGNLRSVHKALEHNSFLELNDKVVNGILTTSSSLVARDSFFKAMSHFLHETPVGQLSITQTLLDTFLSSVTSYIETRSIAIATKKIYKLDEGI